MRHRGHHHDDKPVGDRGKKGGSHNGRAPATTAHGHRDGPKRAQRGDVRTAVMVVLTDGPMHGYQIMQAISDRTAGAWKPSPGAIYPVLSQLEAEGLVTTHEADGRRTVELTSAGLSSVRQRTAERGDPLLQFDDAVSASTTELRDALDAVAVAVDQLEVSATTEEVEAAVHLLQRTRRSLYLILAGEPADIEG